ncbi:RHS repeat-associated core domain-containing protein [Fimbriiglobus ruber]|nr:RHS repeat-associated core domain-containing protein [Fimbriiglobus ruber]
MVDRDTDTSGTGLTATGSGYQRLWPAQDANWNVVALVNGSSAVVERYAYAPFGAVTVLDGSYGARSGSSYGWTVMYQGMTRDIVSGLIEANRRWYSEELGRWIKTDPLGFNGGSDNFYQFVGNKPLDSVDPSGLFNPGAFGPGANAGWKTGALSGVVVGAIVGAAIGAPFGVDGFFTGGIYGAAIGGVAGGVIGYAAGGV